MRGVVAAGHPLTARGRGRCAAGGRQRGRRRGGRRADVVRGRVAAHRPGRRRLHGRPRGRRGPRARLLRRRARARRSRTASRPRSCRSTCASRRTRCSASTSGPSSCGAYGTTLGLAEALRALRHGAARPISRRRRRAPRARASRSCRCRRSCSRCSSRSSRSTPECAAIYAPEGRLLRRGRHDPRCPSWATCSTASGAEGPGFLYDGDVARAVSDWVLERGGLLSREDLASYEVIEREPARVELPRPRGAHEPAALLGRDPDRGRARHPRAARPAARPVRDRRGDRVDEPRARRGVPRRPRDRGLPGALPRQAGARHGGHRGALAAREHHAHLGDGRRGRAARRSPARTARARAWSCRARACTSTTCSASRT